MQVIKTRKGAVYREKIYVDGKAHHSPRFLRKSDAIQWKARMLSEKGKYLSTGIAPEVFQDEDKKIPSFEEFTKLWMNTRVKLQLSERTFEHYGNVVRKHLLPRFGNLKLNQIQLKHGHELIQDLQAANHNSGGINIIVSILKRIVIEAIKQELIVKNPFLHLRELKKPQASDVFMTSEEIQKVLDSSRGHHFYSLFIIAVNSGLRRGEVAGLCWDKVNFDVNLIEISRIRDRNGLGDRTKTLRSKRFIPMNVVIKNHLLDLKEKAQSDLVVVNENNSEFDINHIYRDFRRFLRRAGIKKHYRFHDLRHTFASHFMMNGGNIYDLQKILGHTSLEMTQRYAHLAPEHLVQASNVVSFGANDFKVKLKIAPI